MNYGTEYYINPEYSKWCTVTHISQIWCKPTKLILRTIALWCTNYITAILIVDWGGKVEGDG